MTTTRATSTFGLSAALGLACLCACTPHATSDELRHDAAPHLRIVGRPLVAFERVGLAETGEQFHVYFRTSAALSKTPRGNVTAKVRLEGEYDGLAPIGSVDPKRHCYVTDTEFDSTARSSVLRHPSEGRRIRLTLADPLAGGPPLLTYVRLRVLSDAQRDHELRALGCTP